MKRLMIFLLILFMSLILGCSNKLNVSKNKAISDINAYYNTLDENYYTVDKWDYIEKIVIEKIDLIRNEDDLGQIEEIKNSVIKEIDSIIPIYNIRWLVQQFDFSDEKEIWDGDEEYGFLDNAIFVTLKKTSTYPILDLKYFGLENAISLKYISICPPEHYYELGNEHKLDRYRQILVIYINPMGTEKAVETIRQLEKLDFIKSVRPNSIASGDV